MQKVMLLSLCFVSITASGYCTEVELPHADSPGAHRKHMETRVLSKENLKGSPTTPNRQIVEKEIGEYTKLLEGVKEDNSPLGIMLKTHYSDHLANLQKLLTTGEVGKNIEGQLYQLHQTDSLFSRYY